MKGSPCLELISGVFLEIPFGIQVRDVLFLSIRAHFDQASTWKLSGSDMNGFMGFY